MTDTDTRTFSLKELARATGLTAFAIRHWVNRGLLPPAERVGSNGRFGVGHLHRIVAIQRLRAGGVKLPAIQAQLHGASPHQIRVLAGVEPEAPPEPEAIEPPSAPVVVRSEAAIRNAVDALVCVAAEALDASPRVLRPVLAAVFARMHAEEVTAEDAARLVAAKARD